MKPKSKYTLQLTRDTESGWWTGQLRELSGCITEGRTIEETARNMREAVQAWFDLPRPYAGELDEAVVLPPVVQRALDNAKDARAQAESHTREAAEKTDRALKELAKIGLSNRDAGYMLGITRQRAQKLRAG